MILAVNCFKPAEVLAFISNRLLCRSTQVLIRSCHCQLTFSAFLAAFYFVRLWIMHVVLSVCMICLMCSLGFSAEGLSFSFSWLKNLKLRFRLWNLDGISEANQLCPLHWRRELSLSCWIAKNDSHSLSWIDVLLFLHGMFGSFCMACLPQSIIE